MDDPRCAFDLHVLCAEKLLHYTKQVHFQWKMTHYLLSTSKSEQVFSDLLPQLWQQSWSHWENCKHHQLLLPQYHC